MKILIGVTFLLSLTACEQRRADSLPLPETTLEANTSFGNRTVEKYKDGNVSCYIIIGSRSMAMSCLEVKNE